MILRKPYAFLIKYFKLIHLIITVVTVFLLYKTANIYSFVNQYVSSNQIVVGQEITGNLFNVWMYLGVITMVVLFASVLVLMSQKKKPVIFYVVNIIVYTAMFIIFVISQNFLGQMEIKVVDIRIVRAIRDFMVALISLQFVSIFMNLIRATGFDVKKFNFVKDLEELDIKAEDNEEFEVDVEFDFDKTKRKIKRKIRHIKYVYIENKFLITILAFILFLVSLVLIIKNTNLGKTIYHQGQYIKTSYYTMNVLDTYTTSKLYDGTKPDDGYILGVVRLKIKKNFENGKVQKFATTRLELVVGKNKFYPTSKYRDKVFDFGMNYSDNEITTDYYTYIFIYEIPKHLKNKSMKLRYLDENDNDYDVSIGLINLDNIKTNYLKNNEEQVLNEDLFGKTTLKIESAEISDKMIVDYKFCVSSRECYQSKDYITPDLSDNDDKTLLKLNASLSFDDEYTNDYITSLDDIIKYFGKIEYKIDNNIYSSSIKIKKVSNDKSNKYLEIKKEVEQSDEAYLVINLENIIYKYKIK